MLRRRVSFKAVAVALLAVQAALLAWSAHRHSPTYDEVAHLPAGISHWLGDYRLFRVNPPLTRMVAALPVLAVGAEYDWAELSKVIAADSQKRVDFNVGRDFVAANGTRAFRLYTLSRWACIPVVLLGGIVVWLWATELYGPWGGLTSLAAWTFSPMVLGHGSLITPDVSAASFGVLAMYRFWKWIVVPDWDSAYLCGFCLGLAILCKTTWIILPATMFAIWIASQIVRKGGGRQWKIESIQFALVMLVAWVLLCTGYQGDGMFRRLDSFSFSSASLTRQLPQPHPPVNCFKETWLGRVPVPLPEQFVLGIDLQKQSFEKQTQSYLWGELRVGGWWYYYLFAVAVKSPLGFLGLFLATTAWRLMRPLSGLGWHDACVLIPLIATLVMVSSQTGINKHLRYLLPAYPFAMIWMGQCVRFARWKPLRIAIAGCGAWSIASSLLIFPHSMSYFNELAGGPKNGHHLLINSNVDWGQDLFYLKEKLAELGWDHIGMVYWGRYDARLAGISFHVPPRGPIETIPPGRYAISVNHLHGYAFDVPNEHGRMTAGTQNAYSYFQQLEPVGSAAYSMLLYEVPTVESNKAGKR